MGELIRRIGHDMRHQRNLDAYAASVLVFAVAVLSVVADSLTAHFRWAVLLVGVGVLVFRITLPAGCAGTQAMCCTTGPPSTTSRFPRGCARRVEFHGFHNQVTNTWMHIELTRAESEQWYGYWIEQFERIWQAARPSREPGEHADSV